jgi:uncharacterized protein (DUF427 family)
MSLVDLATRLLKNGPHKTELCPRRIRVLLNNKYIVDTLSSLYVWEHPYYPYCYTPTKDIAEYLVDGTKVLSGNADDGSAVVQNVKVRDVLKEGVALSFEVPENSPAHALNGLTRLTFGSMDQWYEEDVPIYVHPKDPYKRVDVLPSSRHIQIKIDGETIAESNRCVLLFETMLPTRYYFPQSSVNWELVSWQGSGEMSRCPYKGEAKFLDVQTSNGQSYPGHAWSYRYPIVESALIAGHICFYNEKVDIWIDGVKEDRPKTKFS